MQDRYTGDLGDFSKLGILRALQPAGLSIGVNWYLTPDENHNGDGRHVKYLSQEEYNMSYIIPEVILTLVLLALPPVRTAFSELKKMALN